MSFVGKFTQNHPNGGNVFQYFFAILVLSILGISAYIENVYTSGCQSCTIYMTCRHFDSIISILEVSFHAENIIPENQTTIEDHSRTIQLRLALNRRCSGMNHCSFILIKDCPGGDAWGVGNLTIKYGCIAEKRVTKYCNSEVILPYSEAMRVTQGFIHNPGYPRFYLGQQECRWKIRAPPRQQIKIIVFDLSLVKEPNNNECSDLLIVSESDRTLYSSCRQQEPPMEVVSEGETIEIALIPSMRESLIPQRGVLLFYSAVGCPTPAPPSDGYLVYRNESAAVFSCCVGFAFPDTKTRRRVVRCLGDQWDTPLPLTDCDRNVTPLNDDPLVVSSKEWLIQKRAMGDEAKTSDIIIPTAIILMLFFINGIVLFVIYRYKQKQSKVFEEEELKVMRELEQITNTA